MTSDQGPLARLEDVKGDAGAPGEVFRLLTDEGAAKTLAEVAKAWRVPNGRFVEWFTTQHAGLYDIALKVRAADLAEAALKAALEAKPETVAVAKLQADVAMKLAARFDRARFGESVKVERDVTLKIDAGLLGTAGELLARFRAARPVERVIEEDAVAQLPNTVTATPAAGTERRGVARVSPITLADLI